MTSREERARQRAEWSARREQQLADHLYLARIVVGELAGVGRWDAATATSITASLEELARKADVHDAYQRMVQP